METPYPSKPPRLSTIFDSHRDPVYFVTFCRFRRRRVLACETAHQALRTYAERGYTEHSIAVGRYVIMPDHVHLFVCGGEDFDSGLWVRGLKRAITTALEAEPPGMAAATIPKFSTPLWQRGFFDHLLRSPESYAGKWEYVRQNPVRAGLVAQWED